VQIIRRLDALRDALATFRREGHRIALVPTMGALHEGHMALIDAARRAAERVVVSIFVNPTLFGPNVDFARYPRREQADVRMLTEAGVDLLWMPGVEEMYPDGFTTSVSVRGVSEMLEGAHRPGHFDGVATVVAKLFGQVRPDVALFGEKDWQQLAVIRRMASDLDLGVEVTGVALPRAIGAAARAIEGGGDVAEALAQARESLTGAGFDVDYVELVDAQTLGPVDPTRPARLLVAARIGGTRLIDNVPVRLS
jgi:pantoate--beta-alanine ligase